MATINFTSKSIKGIDSMPFDPRPWSPRWLLLLLFCHFAAATFFREFFHIHWMRIMKSYDFFSTHKKNRYQPVSLWNRIRHWQKIEIHHRKMTWARDFKLSSLWTEILNYWVKGFPNLIVSPRTFLSVSLIAPVCSVLFLIVVLSSAISVCVSPTYSTFRMDF